MNTDSERGEGPRFIPEGQSLAEELQNCKPSVEDVVYALGIAINAPTKTDAWHTAANQYRAHHRDQPCCQASRNCDEYCNFVCRLFSWLHEWAWRDRMNYLYEFLISMVYCFNWGEEELIQFEQELEEELDIYPSLSYAAAI